MKRRFFYPFLCLMLSGCLGGDGKGSGGGSTSSNKKSKPCTTPIPNAKERGLLWKSTTKKYGTTCKLISCSSGFVKNTGGNSCDIPRTGMYADNSGSEQSCSSIRGDTGGFETFLANTGAVGVDTGCGFSCNAGFVKNSENRTCNFPRKGKYVDGSGSEQSCSSIRGDTGGFETFLANTGAVGVDTGCGFSCNAGFVKNSENRTCNFPRKGKYVDGSGSEQSCSNLGGTAGGFNEFSDNTKGVSAATGCNFSCKSGYVKSVSDYSCTQGQTCHIANGNGLKETPSDPCQVVDCNAGFVKNTGANSCGIPGLGKYVDNVGREQSCDNPTGDSDGFNTFLPNTGAVPTATDCNFSCNTGFVKSGRSCNIPTKGKYVNVSGREQSCDNPTGDSDGFNTFLPNTGAVPTATDCNFSCKLGYVKSVSTYSCNKAEPCDITNGDGFKQNPSDSCQVIDCNTGYVKNTGANSCDIPDTGKYADNGVAKDCSPITGGTGGFNAFAGNTGAVTAADGCGFSCNSGYVKDSSGRACNYPTLGHYLDASGTEVSCTDITGIPNFKSWVSGAATDADSCPFSCASGYRVSGRTCIKGRIPQMLALGTDTTRILFNNGEVEVWGVNPYRLSSTHFKEDLGSYTPQALVSGYNSQCIILKNGNLNYGHLMCWGKNTYGQLGVGDTNRRSTPTGVSAVGHDENGNLNMVKSVSVGEYHTCAILTNDTVVCWGNNIWGQIGGSGRLGARKTISGTVGDPLSGETANRIAVQKHTCAILSSDSSVQCWGNNHYSKTGGGTPNLGGKTATEIAAGGSFSCAILNDASVVCWGGIVSPTLGNKTATEIVAGEEHACALLNDKTVKCWGGNNQGQIGGGAAGTDWVLRGTVGDPLNGQTAIQIATGNQHSCAIMESDNSVKCWGINTDYNNTGSYGQIVGELAMTGGSDGTGTSTGRTATLTATPAPTATSLDSDEDGKFCRLTLSNTSIVKRYYSVSPTYNTGGNTAISDAIDNLIAAIGSTLNVVGTTNVTLSREGHKITATVNNAVLNGMDLTIHHVNNGGDCSSSVATAIPLSGANGAAGAEGLWVISHDFTGTGDKTVNLDTVHIDLGTSPLTKEEIADKIVADVNNARWAGKQYKDLPYTATKLDGSSDANDDCPANDFCVVFNRVFKGTEGNYSIPFVDRDYSY